MNEFESAKKLDIPRRRRKKSPQNAAWILRKVSIQITEWDEPNPDAVDVVHECIEYLKYKEKLHEVA